MVFDFNSEIFYTEYIGVKKLTRGIETSKYLQEEKSTEIFKVAASEMEIGQTQQFLLGVVGQSICTWMVSRIYWKVGP